MFEGIANIDADVTGGIRHGSVFKKLTGGEPVAGPTANSTHALTDQQTTLLGQRSARHEVRRKRVLLSGAHRRVPTEFTVSHRPEPNKGPKLEAELLDELPSILNWALDDLDCLFSHDWFINEGEDEDKRRRWRVGTTRSTGPSRSVSTPTQR